MIILAVAVWALSGIWGMAWKESKDRDVLAWEIPFIVIIGGFGGFIFAFSAICGWVNWEQPVIRRRNR